MQAEAEPADLVNFLFQQQ